MVEIDNDDKLIATGMDHDADLRRRVIIPTEIAARNKSLRSLDFGTDVDVDGAVYHDNPIERYFRSSEMLGSDICWVCCPIQWVS